MVLTPREAEILAALTRHRTNAEIAAELFISVRTVETHVSSLLRKLGAHDRRELAERAGPELLGSSGRDVPALVGRDTDILRLQELVLDPGLVTVLGTGGVGKTSLVRTLRGSVLVELAPLPAGSSVAQVATVALDALGLLLPEDRDPVGVVATDVARRRVVLVLDNCEHVVEGVAELARALTRSAPVAVVATSRERLGVPGERVLRLEPLAPAAALELFTLRAGALDPPVALDPDELPTVRAICAAVECLPLAVELAAARLGQLGLEDLAHGVRTGIDVLEGGRAAGRQRSIRSVLDWSHQLLLPTDQLVHRRLAVLSGSFAIRTAEAVVGDDVSLAGSVARLVDASLLVREPGDRYRQLDLVRAHARERLLAAGDYDVAADGLLRWAEARLATGELTEDTADLRAAAVAAERLGTQRGVAVLRRLAAAWCDQGAWPDAVDCWERAARAGGRSADALAAADLAASRWQGDRAWQLCELVAETAGDDPAPLVRSLAGRIELAARFPATLAHPPSTAVLEDLLARARAVDTGGDLVSEGLLACAESWVRSTRGDHVGAQADARRAVELARSASDPVLESAAWDALAGVAADDGDGALFHDASEQRLSLRDRLVGSPRAEMERSDLETMAVEAALAVGRFAEARERALSVLERERVRGLTHVGLGRLASCEFHLGMFDAALTHTAQAVGEWEAAGGGPAGYLVAPVSACVAICGYRDLAEDENDWLELADRLSTRPEGAGELPLMRALRADVQLFHDRAGPATALVAAPAWDVAGPHRSLYAAVRAAALGGQAVDDAVRLLCGNRYAEGIVARARGRLDDAIALFAECGASFEEARTRVARDPADHASRRRLAGFLAPSPATGEPSG